MPAEWALSIVVPIFKWKGDKRNCICFTAVSAVVERVLEKRFVE